MPGQRLHRGDLASAAILLAVSCILGWQALPLFRALLEDGPANGRWIGPLASGLVLASLGGIGLLSLVRGAATHLALKNGRAVEIEVRALTRVRRLGAGRELYRLTLAVWPPSAPPLVADVERVLGPNDLPWLTPGRRGVGVLHPRDARRILLP